MQRGRLVEVGRAGGRYMVSIQHQQLVHCSIAERHGYRYQTMYVAAIILGDEIVKRAYTRRPTKGRKQLA